MPSGSLEAAPLAWPPAAAAHYVLPAVPYLRLRMTLRAQAAARLPQYKGSLLRGAFGHALRSAVCAMGPHQACESCRLRRACVYTRVFETFIEGEPPPFLRGLPTSPRPYIFEPASEAREIPAGGEMGLDLLLIGQALDLQAYALLAVERMATTGLGRDRHRFTLEAVKSMAPSGEWNEVDLTGNGGGGAPPTLVSWLPPPASEPAPAPMSARAVLRFLTPTRIKIRDRLAPSITPRQLIFSILRRTLELAHFHVPGAEIDWTFRPLLDHASGVRVVASDLRWHDWERYSNRQRTKMSLGGFVGTLEIEGELEPLWPLLRTAEVLHVGKGATFGLGKVAVVE